MFDRLHEWELKDVFVPKLKKSFLSDDGFVGMCDDIEAAKWDRLANGFLACGSDETSGCKGHEHTSTLYRCVEP